ncbi:MAG: sulfite oxidase-like oxidoreductase [Deltaproteobacteria bacterium]|nr:sulfite oxidase-like oxidoreductase [Deltaproteobacteria bacterium]MBI3077556.1 sulfite oxidase-like oxidoreductase [Deltaproteobacteria bacterium]
MAAGSREAVPPGQYVTRDFPVLHVGGIPRFDPQRWAFSIFGEVEEPVQLTYQEFMALPTVRVVADFHCVTTWSAMGIAWEGVAFTEVMKRVRPKPGARFVMLHSEGGYSTNVPLDVLLDEDVLFAYRRDGHDLEPEHGWPLRLVVPKRYGWKSAKWVRGLEFMLKDRPGFWEQRGYNNSADPWQEERYW